MTKRSKATTRILLLLLLAAVSISAACGNNQPFDSAAWLKGDARARGRMSEDLVNSKVLLGRSLAEARRLLGAPETDWGRVVQYQIDLGWAFKDPKHYGLQLHLDEEGNVREVRIVD